MLERELAQLTTNTAYDVQPLGFQLLTRESGQLEHSANTVKSKYLSSTSLNIGLKIR